MRPPGFPLIEIEQGEESSPTFCDCCGTATRTVNGYAFDELGARATYFVRWTEDHVAHSGAEFDLVIGEWGGAPVSKRVAISLAYRLTDTGPGFMIVDARDRSGSDGLAGRKLKREEVIGTPLATEVFAIIDAVWLQDSRIFGLRAGD